MECSKLNLTNSFKDVWESRDMQELKSELLACQLRSELKPQRPRTSWRSKPEKSEN